MKRLFLPIAAAACVLAAAGGPLSGCTDSGPIPIGYVGGLTGRHYNLGISGRNGAELAVNDVNVRGGIHGRKVKLLVKDDRQDPESALRAEQELIEAGAPVIIGPMTSTMAKATLPLIDRSKVLMISPTVSGHEFSGRDDNLIMLNTSNRQAAEFMAEHLATARQIRTAAVIYDLSNRAYSEVLANFFRDAFRKHGGTVTASETFTSGDKLSFSALTRKALARSPHALLVIAGSLDTSMIFQQARKQNTRVQLVTSLWGSTSDLIEHGGTATEGAIFIQPVHSRGEQPAYEAFRQRYTERYAAEPDFAAVLSYESVQVAVFGLMHAADPAAIKAAVVAQGTFSGLQGDFTIDRNGDPQRRQFVMTVRNGAIEAVD